jgi:hypothetical protein
MKGEPTVPACRTFEFVEGKLDFALRLLLVALIRHLAPHYGVAFWNSINLA